MISESGLDVLGVHLCQHLHLQDLQALKHTSKQLQAWITSLPEPAWHAVAAKTLPPYHPALCSGGVGTYLAWQTARDRQFAAALAAGASSWPCAALSSADAQPPSTAQAPVSSLSHDLRTMARAESPNGGRLVLRQLQTGSGPGMLLHAGYQLPLQRHMVFSPDDRYVAVLMPKQKGPQNARPARGCCIMLMSNPPDLDWPRTFMYDDRITCSPHFDKLEWAANSRMFCLTTGSEGTYPKPDFWVLDENLALLCHFQAGISGRRHHVVWNASRTGMLAQCLELSTAWHWCTFRTQHASSLSQGCWFQHMHWGSWLPGIGEVILTSSKQYGRESPLTRLACCLLKPDMSKPSEPAVSELGLLLDAPDVALWTASMRHVAVVTTNASSSMLQLFVLEPGPHLLLLHSLEMGAEILQVTFSPDGRYLPAGS